MTVSVALEADLDTVADAVGVSPRTVVALPPSSVDPIWDEMRVMIDGAQISRAFDPGDDIVTGAPIPYVTTGGNTYVTTTGNRYVTKVAT